jgi:hypothetical protein
MAQGEGPEFKPQYCKKKKKETTLKCFPSNMKKSLLISFTYNEHRNR